MNTRRIAQVSLLIVLLLGLALKERPDGRLHVVFFETSGDAVLIQTPRGRHILIDGGSDPATLATSLGRWMPFWKRHLDAVILTVPDRAHLTGQLAALARYPSAIAISPALAVQNASSREWVRLLTADRTRVQVLQAGTRLEIDGVRFEVLALGDGRETGALVRMDYGATSAVFAHSSAAADEDALAAAGKLRRATLLVFPWQRDPHTEFVAALAPQAIVLTEGMVAERPLEQTLPERASGGASLFHERLHGTIEWVSDGQRATVVVARHYCGSSPTAWATSPSPFHSDSAICSKRDRS